MWMGRHHCSGPLPFSATPVRPASSSVPDRVSRNGAIPVPPSLLSLHGAVHMLCNRLPPQSVIQHLR